MRDNIQVYHKCDIKETRRETHKILKVDQLNLKAYQLLQKQIQHISVVIQKQK